MLCNRANRTFFATLSEFKNKNYTVYTPKLYTKLKYIQKAILFYRADVENSLTTKNYVALNLSVYNKQ